MCSRVSTRVVQTCAVTCHRPYTTNSCPTAQPGSARGHIFSDGRGRAFIERPACIALTFLSPPSHSNLPPQLPNGHSHVASVPRLPHVDRSGSAAQASAEATRRRLAPQGRPGERHHIWTSRCGQGNPVEADRGGLRAVSREYGRHPASRDRQEVEDGSRGGAICQSR